jgi:putative N-acetyltransferase (TIGR04045 family)
MRCVLVALGVRNVTFDPFEPFVPPQFGIKLADERWEHDEALALRRYVFCHEQHIFASDDRDRVDESGRATTIVAVDYIMGMTHRVVGTVRIAETAPGVWYGSRLAIAPAYRKTYGLGSGLIYRAVTTAHGRGAHTFLAYVQHNNVALFERLAWTTHETCELHGLAHALMAADLRAYPAAGASAGATVLHTRRAS